MGYVRYHGVCKVNIWTLADIKYNFR